MVADAAGADCADLVAAEVVANLDCFVAFDGFDGYVGLLDFKSSFVQFGECVFDGGQLVFPVPVLLTSIYK